VRTPGESSDESSTPERALREALDEMAGLDFLKEPPLALPLETGL
jgi:hypothetical protein